MTASLLTPETDGPIDGGIEPDPAAPIRSAPTRRAIFVRYVAFAVLAGACNFAAQEAVVRLAPRLPILVSVLVGTGVGFGAKYVLDKRWIFQDAYAGHGAEMRKVAAYGLVSVLTTLVFWAAELGAWHGFGTAEAKYAGGAFGLALGNWIKYRLDRRYVFRRIAP